MAWTYLFLAGLCEVGWSVGLKYTDGFSRLVPSVLTIAAMAASMFLLALALRTLPIGSAYAVWTDSAPSLQAFFSLARAWNLRVSSAF